MTTPPIDLSRIAVHTVTTRPLSLEQAAAAYAERGFGGICVWREHLPDGDATLAKKIVEDKGLEVASVVRGGFFVSDESTIRNDAIDDTRRAIDEAATIGAPTLVIVPGAQTNVSRGDALEHVRAGLESVADHAAANGIQLGIEPLHPVFASDRSCICTIAEAMDLIRAIGHSSLALVIDAYHVWWEQRLADRIHEVAQARVPVTFHVSDWVTPMGDPLTSRAVMGDGCIPLRAIRSMVEETSFDGFVEVEILSEAGWRQDQKMWLDQIAVACRTHV